MNGKAIRTLFEYNYWAHERVWACILKLQNAEFTHDLGYSVGSLRNQLVHVMSVDQRWIARVRGGALPAHLEYADYPTREAVREKWQMVEQDARAFVAQMDEEQFSRVVMYELAHRGGTKHDAVWQILAHIVNHGTDHRAQMLAMLHQMGAATVEQDMMFYFWEVA